MPIVIKLTKLAPPDEVLALLQPLRERRREPRVDHEGEVAGDDGAARGDVEHAANAETREEKESRNLWILKSPKFYKSTMQHQCS